LLFAFLPFAICYLLFCLLRFANLLFAICFSGETLFQLASMGTL